MDFLQSAWKFACAPDGNTMFQSYAWNRLAAQLFGDRESPFVVMAEDDNGVAIIPAAVSLVSRSLVFIGESLFDYRDVLICGDSGALASAWEPLLLLKLPLSVTAVRGRAAQWVNFAPFPFCNAPCVPRASLSSREMEERHRKLGRFTRRLARNGVVLQRHSGKNSSLLRWIYRQKARQFHGSGNNLFADEYRIEFIVAASALDVSGCEIFTYECASRILAALVTFRERGVRRFYTVVFDPAWARESPGQVLVFETSIATLAEDLDCDYMTGEQPHKTRLATSSVPLFRVQLTPEELENSVDALKGAIAA